MCCHDPSGRRRGPVGEHKEHKSVVQRFDDLEAALTLLNANGLVFGDFRPPNIMISADGEHAKLVNFDLGHKAR